MNSSLNINRVPWILEESLSNLTSYVSCKILKEMILLDDLQPHFYRELPKFKHDYAQKILKNSNYCCSKIPRVVWGWVSKIIVVQPLASSWKCCLA